MLDVSLQILCTRKSGTLSRIIRELKLFGLHYQSHEIDYLGDQTQIIINSTGDLNCTRETLEELFSNFPEVLMVQKLEITRDGRDITAFKTTASEAQISAQEQISPAIILAAEKRLSDILGPVASFIVETASSNCQNAGELYSLISEELSDHKEREKFLSIIVND